MKNSISVMSLFDWFYLKTKQKIQIFDINNMKNKKETKYILMDIN